MIDKPQRYAVVGMKHRGAEQFVAELPPDAPLVLIREPGNKYDRNAIQVWAKDGDGFRHIGYVPKTQNAVLAQFIDATGLPSEVEFKIHTKGENDEPTSVGIYADSEAPKYVNARLHKGNNPYPLIEVV